MTNGIAVDGGRSNGIPLAEPLDSNGKPFDRAKVERAAMLLVELHPLLGYESARRIVENANGLARLRREAVLAQMTRLDEELGLYDSGEKVALASCDTQPKAGDAVAAPLVSGAVDAKGSETPND